MKCIQRILDFMPGNDRRKRCARDAQIAILLAQGEEEIVAGIGFDLDEVLADADLVLAGSAHPEVVQRDQ